MSDCTSAVDNPLETLWADRLADFKGQERAEAVLLLADDPDLIHIAVAWANTNTTRPKKFSRPPKTENPHEWWEWPWQNRTYSRQEVMHKAAYGALHFDRKFRALVGNHIIYPDGTINSLARKYLHARVLKLFETKPPRPSRKKP